MGYDTWIIRPNTPESRLLSHLGFDRETLPVAKWKGRRRKKGGYGKSPAEWRISGEADVEKLCKGIIRIIGGKPAGKRSGQEQRTLDRAERTLKAFANRAERAASTEQATMNRTPPVHSLVQRRFPSASNADVRLVLDAVEKNAPKTVDELLALADWTLGGRPFAWAQARVDFVAAMDNRETDTR